MECVSLFDWSRLACKQFILLEEVAECVAMNASKDTGQTDNTRSLFDSVDIDRCVRTGSDSGVIGKLCRRWEMGADIKRWPASIPTAGMKGGTLRQTWRETQIDNGS